VTRSSRVGAYRSRQVGCCLLFDFLTSASPLKPSASLPISSKGAEPALKNFFGLRGAPQRPGLMRVENPSMGTGSSGWGRVAHGLGRDGGGGGDCGDVRLAHLVESLSEPRVPRCCARMPTGR
jgi:hypothetical protein